MAPQLDLVGRAFLVGIKQYQELHGLEVTVRTPPMDDSEVATVGKARPGGMEECAPERGRASPVKSSKTQARGSLPEQQKTRPKATSKPHSMKQPTCNPAETMPVAAQRESFYDSTNQAAAYPWAYNYWPPPPPPVPPFWGPSTWPAGIQAHPPAAPATLPITAGHCAFCGDRLEAASCAPPTSHQPGPCHLYDAHKCPPQHGGPSNGPGGEHIFPVEVLGTAGTAKDARAAYQRACQLHGASWADHLMTWYYAGFHSGRQGIMKDPT